MSKRTLTGRFRYRIGWGYTLVLECEITNVVDGVKIRSWVDATPQDFKVLADAGHIQTGEGIVR